MEKKDGSLSSPLSFLSSASPSPAEDGTQFYSTLRLLSPAFLDQYRNRDPELGFNGLGELTYYRTYSRVLPNGRKEEWWQTIARVADETAWLLYEKSVQVAPKEDWDLGLRHKHIHFATKLYDKMFNLKFLPGGRGLWAMGTPLTREKKVYDSLSNCAFVSTKLRWVGDRSDDDTKQSAKTLPFRFTMEMLMLGVGVGFDTELGKYNQPLFSPTSGGEKFFRHIAILDSREGWVHSLEECLGQYMCPNRIKVQFDYSKIRPAGIPLKVMGGVASGPEPLKEMHRLISNLCENYAAQKRCIDTRWVVDIMNMIGSCVVCGGIRRTAMIALGPSEKDFINLKDYKINPERTLFGWASNNSVVVSHDNHPVKPDYESIAQGIFTNGEPGVFWLDNARRYSRLADHSEWVDEYAKGTNPCGEQTLDSFELCNLVEVFPSHHDDLEEFLETLEYALAYGKLVASLPLLYTESNEIVKRNKRIGISLTGIADFLDTRSESELVEWCKYGYLSLLDGEKIINSRYGIKKSIKLTTIKPSGTLSLIGGVCSGMHWPVAEFVKRRVCIPENDQHIADFIRSRGFNTYRDPKPPHFTFVEIPISYPHSVCTDLKSRNQNIWQQVHMARLLQTNWSDNQVSCTITFNPELTTVNEIATFLQSCSVDLKSISMLPLVCKQKYDNMPLEEITQAEYLILLSFILHRARNQAFIDKVAQIPPEYFNNDGIIQNPYTFNEKDFCDSDNPNCFICQTVALPLDSLTLDQ